MSRRRVLRLLVGMLLGTAVPLSVLPAGAALADPPGPTQFLAATPPLAEPQGTRGSGSAVGKTLSPFAETDVTADGKGQTKIYRSPAFRRDGAGRRVPVDSTLHLSPDGVFPIQALGSLRPVKLGSDEARLVAIELGNGPVTLAAQGMTVGVPVLGKDGRARYAEVAPQTDLEYTSSPAGLKEDIVLRGPKAPTTFRFHLEDPQRQLGKAVRQRDGGYAFSTPVDDGVVLGLAAPRAYQQPKPGEVPDPGIGNARMTVEPAGSGFNIALTVEQQWLKDQNFPVVLDPTVTFGPANQSIVDVDYPIELNPDTKLYSCGGGPCGLNRDSFLRVGHYGSDVWRGAVRFDLSSIPRGSTVTSARHHHSRYQCSSNTNCPPQDVELHRIDGPWAINSVNMAIINTTGVTVARGPNVATDFDVTSQVQRWVDGTDPNNGVTVQLADDRTSTLWSAYISSRGTSYGTADQLPQLTVDFGAVTPLPPTGATAAAGELSANLSWRPGADNGSPVTSYQVRAYGADGSATSTTCTLGAATCRVDPDGTVRMPFTQLSAQTSYTFDVAASGTSGTGRSSSRTSPGVTPTAPPASPPAGTPTSMPVTEPSPMPLPAQGTGGYTAGAAPAAAPVPGTAPAGLGLEDWWSYDTVPTGDQGTARVNTANGNLVVQQVDSAPVQAHGRLSYTLRRTYNSQDNSAAGNPGGLAAGWSLNLAESLDPAGSADATDGLAAGGDLASAAGAGLEAVAPLTALPVGAGAVPLNLIDRDGTRHTFTPKPLSVPLPLLGAGVPSLTQAAALVPQSLALDASKYTTLCIDQAFTAPAGVHLGLWRYKQVNTTGAGGCSAGPGTAAPAVLGYAALSPDRVRTEYDATGKITMLTDAAGVRLRYLYRQGSTDATGRLAAVYEPRSCTAAPDSSGQVGADAIPATCRAFRLSYSTPVVGADGVRSSTTTVTDPAGRATAYRLEGASAADRLVRVDNPDGTSLDYAYQGLRGATCAGAADGQLCSARDGRGAATAFAYTADGATRRLASLTDRRGTASSYVYEGTRTTRIRADRREVWSGIDGAGRVAEHLDTDTAGTLYRRTSYTWDNAELCRTPEPKVDHNLCAMTEQQVSSASGAAPGSVNRYAYNPDGMLTIARRSNSTGATGSFDSQTYGYRSQYVPSSGGAARVYDDRVAGGGTVTSTSSTTDPGRRADADMTLTLFSVDDRIESLPPRGNAAPAASSGATPGWPAYLTSYRLEADPTKPANASPDSGSCTGTPANTGLVCEVTAPSFQGDAAAAAGTARPSVTRYTYDAFGQRRSMTTPKAIDETPAGTAPKSYAYDYFGDADLDLSGKVSAGGWLRTVTDPNGQYVAFGYDRAGNTSRTWDRNATAGRAPSAFPGALAAPPAGAAYSETLHSDIGGGRDATATALQAAYERPWRHVRSVRTPTGDRTRTVTDANGNPTRTTPPRGTARDVCCTATSSTANDTTRTFDPGDLQLTELLPAETAANGAAADAPTRYAYDPLGNPSATTDPAGAVTTYGYDGADRAIRTSWTRGPQDTSTAPAGCRAAAAGDAPLPAGRTVCSTVTGYDGLDNVVFAADGNSQVSTFGYDALQRRTATVTPRNAGGVATVREQVVYDADGNVTDICPPREFTEPDASKACTETSPYGRHATYDAAGRMSSTSSYRTPGASANTTALRYDADGNETGVTDAKGAVTAAAFDLLDRRTSATQPRSTTESFTTSYRRDGVGNLLTLTHPVTATTTRQDAYSYDAANRLVDTVTGSTSPDAGAAGPYDATAGSNVRQRTFYDADGNQVAWLGPRAFATSVSAPNLGFLRRVDLDADGRTTAEYAPRYDTADGSASDPTGDATQAQQCPTGPASQTVPGVPGYPSTVGVCVTRTSYDSRGMATARTWPTAAGAQPAATGRKTSYRYTDDRLLAAETVPSPTGSGTATTGYRYDGEGRRLAATDPLGDVSTSSWTSDGLLAGTAEQAYMQKSGPDSGATVSHTTGYGYDPDGQQTASTNAKGETTASSYYADGLLKQGSGTAAASTSTGGTGGTTTGGTTTAGAGDTSRYEYDQVGNPVKVYSPSAVAKDATNPNGAPTRNVFTADDLLLSAEQPPGSGGTRQRTAYRYDGDGRKLEQATSRLAPTDPSTGAGTPAGTQAFEYDPAGRITRQTGREEAAGAARPTISSGYDAAGNAVRVTNNASDGTANTVASTFYLDNAPRTIDDGQATTRYGYTGSGKPTTRVQATNGSSAVAPTTKYAYNDADVATSSTASAVSDTPWTWTYDAAGRTLVERDPNNQQTERSYNPDNTLLFQRTMTVGSGGNTVAATTVRHDNLSRRVRQDTTAMDEQGALSSRTELFAYNAAGRVSGYDDGDGMFTATWDADGNRLRYSRPAATGRTAVDERAAYNSDDSLASSATTDDNGTPTALAPAAYTGFGALTDDGCTSYGYDGFDRTTSAQPTPGSRCATATGTSSATAYTYDGLDRQRTRTQTDSTRDTTGTMSTAPAQATDMHYDGLGATVVAETSRTAGSTAAPADSMWTLDPDDDAKSVTTAGAAGKSNYLTDDGHGTISTITNDTAGSTGTGFVACAARLDPWGKPQTPGSGVSPTGASASPCKGGSSSTANDKFYRGLRRDTSTGTYQMGARTYNPNRAAFLSQDSYRTAPTSAELGVGVDPLTMNRYTYVNGDPVNYADPDGHFGIPKWVKKAAKATGHFISTHKTEIASVAAGVACGALTAGVAAAGCALGVGALTGAAKATQNCKGGVGCYAKTITTETALGGLGGAAGKLGKAGALQIADRFGERQGGRIGQLATDNKRGTLFQRHHIPSTSVDGRSFDNGYGIRMATADHRMTGSHGSLGRASAVYRDAERKLIEAGDEKAAAEMGIRDVRMKFGNRYNKGIRQMERQRRRDRR